MANDTWYPRIVVYAERVKDSMVYYTADERTIIEGNATVQQVVLSRCTGRCAANDIVERLSAEYGAYVLSHLLSTLRDNGILVDSHNSWVGFHPLTCNPLPFYHPLSDEAAFALLSDPFSDDAPLSGSDSIAISRTEHSFSELLERRKSVREFTGQGIAVSALKSLLWSAYGRTTSFCVGDLMVVRRTVPSAGGLYPLRLHAVVRKSRGAVAPGIYAIRNDGFFIVEHEQWTNMTSSVERFRECFIADSYLDSFAACIIISAAIHRQTAKYGDRGYRYAILEAGHAAQNVLLCCEALDLGAVEVGGFLDSALSRLLCLRDGVVPITTIFIGPSIAD